MKVYVPGKTFLVGEYSLLAGGRALGLATKPYFSLDTDTQSEQTFHAESPAGRYLREKNKTTTLKLDNPYLVGGYGQSTAEFIFSWLMVHHKNSIDKSDLSKIYSDYRNIFLQDQGVPPSGGDLVTQILGGITLFNPEISNSQSVAWPFTELSFFVISTGLKVPTHEHLANLNTKGLKELLPYSEKTIESFLSRNQQQFLINLKAWCKQLEKNELTHPDVLDLKNQLSDYPEILLVKPCGALGADVCLAFCDQQNKDKVSDVLNSFAISQNGDIKIIIQATENSLSPGAYCGL